MALLNEKRNRIPLVAALPVDGDDGGIRGQMRMKGDATNGIIEVCVVSDQDLVSTLSVSMVAGTIDYTSVPVGDAGEAISVEHDVLGVAIPVVTVTGNAILVSGDGTTTPAQILTALGGSAAATALVTAVDNGGSVLNAQAVAFLSGGAGTKATGTFNTDIILTAAASGSTGNDINLTVVDVTGQANIRVAVSGKNITISGDVAVHKTDAMVLALNASSLASRLVVASGGNVGTALAASAAADLTGGASLALWLTVTAV